MVVHEGVGLVSYQVIERSGDSYFLNLWSDSTKNQLVVNKVKMLR